MNENKTNNDTLDLSSVNFDGIVMPKKIDVGELSEAELENALGGAPREVAKDKALENGNIFRPRSIEEIEREKQDLLRQREEALKRGSSYGGR